MLLEFFLKVWHPDFLACDWKEERRSAMRVCATLGVPFLTFDCQKEYKKEVADYMIDEYREGRTPNPDIFCNKYVKFGIFLKKSHRNGGRFCCYRSLCPSGKDRTITNLFLPPHHRSTDKFLRNFPQVSATCLAKPPETMRFNKIFLVIILNYMKRLMKIKTRVIFCIH